MVMGATNRVASTSQSHRHLVLFVNVPFPSEKKLVECSLLLSPLGDAVQTLRGNTVEGNIVTSSTGWPLPLPVMIPTFCRIMFRHRQGDNFRLFSRLSSSSKIIYSATPVTPFEVKRTHRDDFGGAL